MVQSEADLWFQDLKNIFSYTKLKSFLEPFNIPSLYFIEPLLQGVKLGLPSINSTPSPFVILLTLVLSEYHFPLPGSPFQWPSFLGNLVLGLLTAENNSPSVFLSPTFPNPDLKVHGLDINLEWDKYEAGLTQEEWGNFSLKHIREY